jgi:hypothetical protein
MELIDILIIVLHVLRFDIIVLGVAGALLMIINLLVDLFYHINLETIHLPKRRVGRHRQSFIKTISRYRLKMKARKEESNRIDRLFNESYPPGFDPNGKLICRDTSWFSTEKFRRYYRQPRHGLANNRISKIIEVH